MVSDLGAGQWAGGRAAGQRDRGHCRQQRQRGQLWDKKGPVLTKQTCRALECFPLSGQHKDSGSILSTNSEPHSSFRWG